MAQHRGKDGPWPRDNPETGANRGDPVMRSLNPDGIWRSDRSVAGPLRLGTAPGVGPKGPAVIADYERRSDYGTDMIARDRKIERKFPSELVSAEIRGNTRDNKLSEGKNKPK